MKQNNFKTLIGATALCATLGVQQVAQAVVTAPVGYVKLTFNAESDTPFSLPMNRPMVYSGEASGISGNVISIANTDFTADEFVYADGAQNEHYYVIFTTGALEGRKFDVELNGTNSITVNPDHTDEDTTDTIQSLINGGSENDTFQIRAHWTLNTAFPDGEGITPLTQATIVSPQGELLVHDNDAIGTNNNPSRSYVYFDDETLGNNADFRGWYILNEFDTIVNDTVLRSTEAFVMRNRSQDVSEVNVMGDVPTTDTQNTIVVLSDFIAQDNVKPLEYPIDISLNDLFADVDGVGFIKSTNAAIPEGDRVLLFDDNPVGLNSNPTRQFVFFDAPGETNDGWYNVNNIALGGELGDTDIIRAGSAFVIRKVDDSESSVDLRTNIPYNPFAE